MHAISTYAAEVAAAIRVSFADRTNFVLQFSGMAINNGFVLLLWFMFFKGFRSIGGWRMADVALLVGLLASIVGVAGVLFGGYRDLAAAILRGEPDALLTQPSAVLPRLLARESLATAWGDILTGLILLAALARITPAGLPWLAFALACGLGVYLSVATTFACLAFWMRGARSFARDLTDFVLMFSSYPGSVYSGAAKLVVYTVFPAGFVVLIPVRMLRHPAPELALMLMAAVAAYAALALIAFHMGLQRYRRGDSPGVA